VILRFGLYARTVEEPGLKWHLPPPIESHELVNVGSIEKEQFGFPSAGAAAEEQRLEGTVQTKDNNLAHVGFVVQYKIKNAFFSRYRVANPRDTLRDTAQAALREVIGRTSIDGVLSERRGAVEQETQDLLQKTLDRYETGLLIDGVQLQEVQPPPEVQAAFDDVIGASQDRNRSINEAQGYANEVLPRARAESVELREAAQGFRDAKVAEAQGAATRFTALLDEYRKAPEVTRKRLYLETMEEVLPDVEKVIIEPGTTNVLPYLPLGRAAEGRGGAEPAR
jgi:membrane protease subunit HflK